MVVFEGAIMVAKQSCTVHRMTRPIERIKQRLLDDGVKPREVRTKLAAICGVSYQAVAQWFTTDTDITAENLLLIAKALRTSVEWILTGKEERPPPIHGMSTQPVGTDVPVIHFATLADVAISESFRPATMAVDWTGCTTMHGQRTFAFKMPDNSMASSTDDSIPAGHMVWVDPDQTIAAHDTPVLARLESGQYLVAHYMELAGRRWLHFLNAGYPPSHAAFEIVGRVIHSGKMR